MVCGGLRQAFEPVAVGVEGGLDRRVPEPLLNDLGMLAVGDQEGSVGVAQIMEAARGGPPWDGCCGKRHIDGDAHLAR